MASASRNLVVRIPELDWVRPTTHLLETTACITISVQDDVNTMRQTVERFGGADTPGRLRLPHVSLVASFVRLALGCIGEGQSVGLVPTSPSIRSGISARCLRRPEEKQILSLAEATGEIGPYFLNYLLFSFDRDNSR
jgi:hypothetical protein